MLYSRPKRYDRNAEARTEVLSFDACQSLFATRQEPHMGCVYKTWRRGSGERLYDSRRNEMR